MYVRENFTSTKSSTVETLPKPNCAFYVQRRSGYHLHTPLRLASYQIKLMAQILSLTLKQNLKG